MDYNTTQFLKQCKYNFSSDNINIIILIYDTSSSMDGDVYSMREANEAFFKDFSKFEEKGSIAIAKASFNAFFEIAPFSDVKRFDTNYYASGGTLLYSSINYSAELTIAYYNELVKRLNVRPRITFLVFSDGCDNESPRGALTKAKDSIVKLNSLDATTVFVAFRDAIDNKTGEMLGFTCTKNISTVTELISCLGNELSKSCKEQSKSSYSLKSEFFSKAGQDSSDDLIEEQAIIDDDFFNI